MPPRRDAPSPSRAARLVRLATKLYGKDDWRPALAAEMMVNDTTVSRWERALVAIPQAVFVAVECKLREKG